MAIMTVDLGGTSVKYSVWDKDQLVEVHAFPTPDSWKELKERLGKEKNAFTIQYGIEGVAISAPGAVDTQKGIIGGVSAIPYIHQFQIKEELKDYFGVPVAIQNDANCAALAELWKGAARDNSDVLFVVIGTGIGGAVIIDRRLRAGTHLFGGEFGLMVIDDSETLSVKGTAVRMAQNYSEALTDDKNKFSGKEVFDMADAGDILALRYVDQLYHFLSVGLYNLVVCFDPEKIILGGGLSQRENIAKEISLRVKKLLVEKDVHDLDPVIETCYFKNDANLIGAVYQFDIENNRK